MTVPSFGVHVQRREGDPGETRVWRKISLGADLTLAILASALYGLLSLPP